MHLEATAVLLGLQDLGGKLTAGSHIGWRHPEAKFGHLVGDVEATVGQAEAICHMLFGHVVGFVPQSALPWGQVGLSGGHVEAKPGYGRSC